MGIGFPISFYYKFFWRNMEENKKVKFNPLREETVIVRFIPKEGSEQNKDHVLYGGMAETAVRTYTVPVIASTGSLKNPLTGSEKEYFEEALGVNLSVHNKKDNYWDNFKVRLNKNDNYFDLSNVEDYLKYKVLLTNTQFICPSLEQLEQRPLATYQYVIIAEGQEMKMAVSKRHLKKECFKLAGKIESDYEMLKTVIEMLDKRPVSAKTDITFLANKLDEHIEEDANAVYRILTNETLPSMVMITKCVAAGLIVKTGDFYYLKSGKSKIPMCEDGKDPDINQAIKYLHNPKNQEIKFTLESQLK
jgi:hypothetical protein